MTGDKGNPREKHSQEYIHREQTMIHNPIARLVGMAPVSLPRAAAPAEETLVADDRSGVTPAQMVDRRLLFLLHGTPPSPVSDKAFRPRRALCFTGAEDET
jgi:hypothetical protein